MALRQLHWLPVQQRIQYKLASLALHTLSDLVPDYLAGDCQLVAFSGWGPLWSATRLPCATSEQYLWWLFLRCRRPAHMEWAPVQPTRHWAITDYFQRTSENVLILRRVLRPRCICDIYDLFAPCINLLTYLAVRCDWCVKMFVTNYQRHLCNVLPTEFVHGIIRITKLLSSKKF